MEKNFFQSKTCWGALLLTVGFVAEGLGWNGILPKVLEGLGVGGAIWGFRDKLG